MGTSVQHATDGFCSSFLRSRIGPGEPGESGVFFCFFFFANPSFSGWGDKVRNASFLKFRTPFQNSRPTGRVSGELSILSWHGITPLRSRGYLVYGQACVSDKPSAADRLPNPDLSDPANVVHVSTHNAMFRSSHSLEIQTPSMLDL